MILPDVENVQDVLTLVEDPQWVGTHMHFTLGKPRKGIISIVAKLLEGKALEEGRKGQRGHNFLLSKREMTLLFHNWWNTLSLFRHLN